MVSSTRNTQRQSHRTDLSAHLPHKYPFKTIGGGTTEQRITITRVIVIILRLNHHRNHKEGMYVMNNRQEIVAFVLRAVTKLKGKSQNAKENYEFCDYEQTQTQWKVYCRDEAVC